MTTTDQPHPLPLHAVPRRGTPPLPADEYEAVTHWAHALSDLSLASHLACLADDVRHLSPLQRGALLMEAAHRFEENL